MKLKDIIINVATYLSRKDVVDYLESTASSETYPSELIQTVSILKKLTNNLIKEIATTYVEMTFIDDISPANRIFVDSLSHSPLFIYNVYDKDDCKIDFTVKGEYIDTDKTAYKIEYSFIPEEYELDDELKFNKEISLNVITYGVMAEHSLIGWKFDEAVMWRERFSDGLKSLIKPKNKSIKARIWR